MFLLFCFTFLLVQAILIMQWHQLLHGRQCSQSVGHPPSLKAFWPCLFLKIKCGFLISFFLSRYSATLKAPQSSCFYGWKSFASPSSALHTACLHHPRSEEEKKIQTYKIALIRVLTQEECPWKGTAYVFFLMPSQAPITTIHHGILQTQRLKCKNGHEVFRKIDHQNNNIWHLSQQEQG